MQILSSFRSSFDDTIKYQIQTADNYTIEACVIFFWDKTAPINICISSQVGCECRCSFCITGHKKYIRNLSSEEILDQVNLIFQHSPELYSHFFEITYMGTGEPLLNMSAMFASAQLIANRYHLLSRINISSIFPHSDVPIEEIKMLSCPVHFQYSLHFLTDDLRTKYFRRKLAPISDALSLLTKISAITNRKFCINYILFEGINDSIADAKKLAQIVKSVPAYVKISQYCPITNSQLQPSQNFSNFTDVLSSSGIPWKYFESKGADIHAACGHLLSDVQF